MIQQIQIALNVYSRFRDRWIFLFLMLLAISLTTLFYSYPIIKPDELNSLLANVIQFAGIFSAILITFIISKVFQIRQEKLQVFNAAESISNKVTHFRRIARIIINCRGFWQSQMRTYVDQNFQYLTKFDMRNFDLPDNDPTEILRKRYYAEQNTDNPNYYGVELYMDLKSLVLDYGYPEWELYDDFDRNGVYSNELVEKWIHYHSGDLWYFLVNEWSQYDLTFHIHAFSKADKEKILGLATKIDEKYKGRELDNKLLGDIGSDFISYYFPMLYEKTDYLSKGLPPLLIILLVILTITVSCGVILPIIINSTAIEFQAREVLTYLSLTILICSLVYFLLKFRKLMESVIRFI